MPTLLWFRRDLRLHDLPALLDAADADGEVLACYVLDPRLKASSGPRRLQYLYDALRELRRRTRRQADGDPRSARQANPGIGQGDRRHVGARVGRLHAVRHAAATTPFATRSATFRWRSPVRRIWCRLAASPRATARPTRCSPRSTEHGRSTAGERPRSRARNRRSWIDPADVHGRSRNSRRRRRTRASRR